MFSVENITADTQEELVDFLKKHEDFSLFLLGNLEAYGHKMTDAPNSGNYQLIRRFGECVAAFCLTRRGTLLVQAEAPESIFGMILTSCQKEAVPLKGVAGEWNFCHSFWEFLKNQLVIKQENFASKDVLYSLDLSNKFYPNEERVRLLGPDDFPKWQQLNVEYILEQKLPNDLGEDQVKNQFLWKADQQIIWGLFVDNDLRSIAELNAKALDLGQVGGVYTSPYFRKQGLATALMRQLAMDAKEIHGIKKLMIFTDENNIPAQKVYESLGVKQVGHFALLFGNETIHHVKPTLHSKCRYNP